MKEEINTNFHSGLLGCDFGNSNSHCWSVCFRVTMMEYQPTVTDLVLALTPSLPLSLSDSCFRFCLRIYTRQAGTS